VDPPIENRGSYDYRVVLVKIVDREVRIGEHDGGLWTWWQV